MLKDLLTPSNVLIIVGGAISIGWWIYTHFSKAGAAVDAARLTTIEKYVSMASAAVSAVAAGTTVKWDDYLAMILQKVDETLKAQGAEPLDPGEKASAALQASAIAGSQKLPVRP